MSAAPVDYRTMYDSEFLGAWDLQGRDVTVTIAKVVAGKVTNATKTAKKPLVYFEGKEKALVLNKTNGKAIAGMYGNDTRAWVGKRITMWPTTAMFGGEQKDAIRVRPMIPKGKADTAPTEDNIPDEDK